MSAMVSQSAAISPCGLYRYELRRVWDLSLPPAVFLMLNPSTADAEKDDATIRKCIGFAKRWGRGRLIVVNLFAFRSKDPKILSQYHAPLGPDNWKWIRAAADACAGHAVPLVLAWGGGVPKALRNHIPDVLGQLGSGFEMACLGTTKAGHPRHPLMLAYATRLGPWSLKCLT